MLPAGNAILVDFVDVMIPNSARLKVAIGFMHQLAHQISTIATRDVTGSLNLVRVPHSRKGTWIKNGYVFDSD